MSPPSKPATSPAPTTPSPLTQEERQELITLRREKAALSIYLWNLVRDTHPETHSAEVHPTPSDPLWQLAFVRSSDPKSSRLRILAGTIKPITEQEKKRVVRMLRGTSKPMADALAELGFPFPPSYVEEQIKSHLAWDDTGKYEDGDPRNKGHWQSMTPVTISEKAKNIVRWPK